jgi:RNA-directed DNA polymerase
VGTPQGGVISPQLANIFLHYVLDEWFEQEVRPRLKGQAFLIRYADDFVIGVAHEDDARRLLEVLPKRMSKYGLTVHPEKTRLVRFTPPEDDDSGPTARKPSEPRTFDFLGFTHYWGRSQQGVWVIKRKTAKDRFRRALRAMWEWCRKHLHNPVRDQHRQLRLKLKGHYAYYGIRGNYNRLSAYLRGVRRIWRHWLNRRDNAGSMT